jgi:mannose-6-phosphate isomerase-like protein (cupin superfamily)
LPRRSCYFPAGVMHKFTATSEQPAKVLVIYSPPYGESPQRVARGA